MKIAGGVNVPQDLIDEIALAPQGQCSFKRLWRS